MVAAVKKATSGRDGAEGVVIVVLRSSEQGGETQCLQRKNSTLSFSKQLLPTYLFRNAIKYKYLGGNSIPDV